MVAQVPEAAMAPPAPATQAFQQSPPTDNMAGSGPCQAFYVKRVGYNDIEVLQGSDPHGAVMAYYVEVSAKLAGWDIRVHRGAKAGPEVLRLQKGAHVIDKNSTITVEAPGSTAAPGAAPTHMPIGADGTGNEVTVMVREHEVTSNENVFTYKGRQYAWNWMVMFGATHTMTDVASGQVVARCQLKPCWNPVKWMTDWGLRLNGPVEVMGPGLDMLDLVIGTLCATLEWRKHNNKILSTPLWFI